MKIYQLLWHYQCNPDQKNAFEEAYRRNGTWFNLYAKCEDYLGLELIKKQDQDEYLVIDRWISKESYEQFIAENKQAYGQLNEQCKSLYQEEKFLGAYESIDV